METFYLELSTTEVKPLNFFSEKRKVLVLLVHYRKQTVSSPQRTSTYIRVYQSK